MLKRYCRTLPRVLCVFAVAMAAAAAADGKVIPTITDKTLVAWVRLANLEQQGSGALSIMSGDEFDSITFGERAAARWMAGSHAFSRTQSAQEQRACPGETAARDECVMVAIAYEGKDIRIFRNGNVVHIGQDVLNFKFFFQICAENQNFDCIHNLSRPPFPKIVDTKLRKINLLSIQRISKGQIQCTILAGKEQNLCLLWCHQ